MSSFCCCKPQTIYKPRRPEKTVLFEVIKKHYNTWSRNSEKPIPNYIEKEFKNYLGCGILAKGFAHAHCSNCDRNFFLRSPVRAEVFVPPAIQKQWLKQQTILWTMLYPVFRFDNSLSLFLSGFDIISKQMKFFKISSGLLLTKSRKD